MSIYNSKKNILAPMVRAGRTPLRVLALSYGADLVYTEEVVDQRLLACQRVVNDALGTVDYLLGDEVVLRIAAEEQAHCVLQIGTNSAENAVKLCRKIGNDVAAIDLNMGCPKPFSIHCGMGAALLGNPDKVKEILTAMVSASVVPVSCKIRLLNSNDETMEFVRMVERCGVSALAVHGRRRDERPTDQCRVNEIRQICRALSIPVIANGYSGNIHSHEGIARFREETGASGVMVARRALANPSIFRSDGILLMEKDIQNFLQKACKYDESFTGTKYVVQRILGNQQEFDPRGRRTVSASTVRQMCHIWDMDDDDVNSISINNKLRRRRRWNRQQTMDDEEMTPNDGGGQAAADGHKETSWGALMMRKRHRHGAGEELASTGTEDWEEDNEVAYQDDDILFAHISFHPRHLKCGVNGKFTPKCVLNSHCVQQLLNIPIYQTRKTGPDHRFAGIVNVNGRKFGSSVTQPNIKMAEQVAALVALHGLNIRHKLEGDWDEQ